MKQSDVIVINKHILVGLTCSYKKQSDFIVKQT